MPQCRACDVDHHRVLPLFSTTGGNLVDLSTMFANVTEVKIIKNDGAPNHLCMVCCKKLQEAYDFKIKCLMIDKKRKESNMRISMEPNSLAESKNPVYLCLKSDNSLVPETLDMLQTDQMYADELLESNIKEDSDTDHLEPELICVDTKVDVKKEYLPDDISHDFSDDDDLPLATRRSKRRKKITNVDVIQDILDSEGPVSRHKEYACIICENVFKNSSSFKVHIISQHSSKQKSEPHTLPTEILKVTHSKNGKNMLKCVICQAGFTCNETLKPHLKSHFPDEYPEESVKRKPVKIAPVVKKVAVAKITKKKVKDKHVPVETPVNCDYCHAKLQDAEDWKEHEARHLAEHKPFRCIYEGCPGVYKTRCALRNHFNTHTQSKSFQCRYCPKRFNQRSNAMSHERTHTGIKPYLCSECGRSFRESGNLNQHMRQHTGEKPYSCHLCPKVFTTLYSRKVHVRTHLKIKPYLCSECGKSFVASGKLLIHKRIHSGYRPYVCKLCEAAFHDSNGLKRHMKIH